MRYEKCLKIILRVCYTKTLNNYAFTGSTRVTIHNFKDLIFKRCAILGCADVEKQRFDGVQSLKNKTPF